MKNISRQKHYSLLKNNSSKYVLPPAFWQTRVSCRAVNYYKLLKIKTMTDAKWLKVIKKCKEHYSKFQDLLLIAEKEYESRFGSHPSDWDDDYWIDTLQHGANYNFSIKEITESAETCTRK